MIETLKKYMRAYKNWPSVMFQMYRASKDTKRNILVKTRDGYVGSMKPEECYIFSLNSMVSKTFKNGVFLNDTIEYDGKTIVLHGINDKNGDVIAIFYREEYKHLIDSSNVVIDVGANIGDSAIYFALNGVSKVIALEPYPYSYDLAQKNVHENHLEDRIILLNAGYGTDSIIHVSEDVHSGIAHSLMVSEEGREIRIYSLKSLIEKYGIRDANLKMDCEGCEYSIINEDVDIIRKFNKMIIEYHYGPDRIVKKLKESGFEVEFTKPKKSYNEHATNKTMIRGLIYATRKQLISKDLEIKG